MSELHAASSASPVEQELVRIRGLMETKHFADACTASRALSAQVPENRDVLYMIAVNQRYLGQIDDALSTLAKLQRLHPGYSRLYQERGHCFVMRRDASQAIDAFLAAVNINPALPASWSRLETLFRMTGRHQEAEMAAGHVAALAKLPLAVVTATGLYADGELGAAEQMIRQFLIENGNHIEAMRLLARIGLEHDVLDDAELLLRAVLELAPDYEAARYDYARTLLRRHQHQQALSELDTLIRLDPANRAYRTTYATAVVGLGQHERALALYQDLLKDAPRSPDLHLSIAHTFKTLGRTQEAIDAYHAAIGARADFGDAYWSLANLKTYRFTDVEIHNMRDSERAESTAVVDRYHLCFALGKALEDRGEYGDSFAHYERGNALKKASTRYRADTIEHNTRMQKQICDAGFFARHQGTGCPAPDPIFIIGLPRSGSTLLEQILASHSQVEGTQELADIPRIVQELQGHEASYDDPQSRRYPRLLAQMTPEEFTRLGEKYIRDTRIYRSGKPFFIDKMPNNFRHVGLIHAMLPNAKIIDARRDPMACCFSNFKQLFAAGQEFTYSLEDIGRYYRTYVELMEHWDSVLPGSILRVQHEDVVDDLEGSVRRILTFCGLAFEPQCLEFHRTERSVRTASSEQVRRPIFREGLDQWRPFEPWLGPLKQALGLPPHA